MKNRILSWMMALMLLIVLAVNASAATTTLMPDLSSHGSLTFTMEYDGAPLKDGRLHTYYIGSIESVAEDVYDFAILPELGASRLTEEQLNDPDVAAAMLENAKKVLGEDARVTAPIVNGQALFEDLATGLYLVWQEEADASANMSAIRPFMISVPRWKGTRFVLDVTAAPKVPIETKPTEPPPPPPPDLPQTGRLNWPIPVLGVSGTILIIVGWILCAGRKRCKYEK